MRSGGNYWIPNFALITKKNGPAGDYFEVIIVDSKLFRSTDWSPNQKVAEKMQEWKIKAVNKDNLIQGIDLGLVKNSPLLRQGQFIKIFEEGSIITTDFK